MYECDQYDKKYELILLDNLRYYLTSEKFFKRFQTDPKTHFNIKPVFLENKLITISFKKAILFPLLNLHNWKRLKLSSIANGKGKIASLSYLAVKL
jgi:hypothetical protein